MNKKKISIIVPVYNVEKYLNKCIESIVNQTYKNLEIILVDDGSTDNCPQICNEWSEKDKRIKVIHKKNGGLSSARNTGIDVATGEYIGFVDSDDFINEKMYEILLNNLINTKSNIASCHLLAFNNYNEINKKNITGDIEIYNTSDKFEQLFNNFINAVCACNKLYERGIFENLRYPEGKLYEDLFISHQIINRAKQIVNISACLYYYYQREDSIMHQKFSEKSLEDLQAYKEQMLFFQKNEYIDTKYSSLALLKYVDKIIIYYCKLIKNNNNNKYSSQIKELRQEYTMQYKAVMKSKITIKRKIKYFIFRYAPKLIYIIKNK